MRGSWRPKRNRNILTPLLWPSMLFLSCSPDAQPEVLGATLLGDGFLYCIISATFLVPKLHRGSRGPVGRVWLSLPHLVLFRLELELNRHRNSTALTSVYIIVKRPLDLWNRMFNRHQAEITVMQFTSHSLPVRQSMSVPWDFLACPILLANFRQRDFLS